MCCQKLSPRDRSCPRRWAGARHDAKPFFGGVYGCSIPPPVAGSIDPRIPPSPRPASVARGCIRMLRFMKREHSRRSPNASAQGIGPPPCPVRCCGLRWRASGSFRQAGASRVMRDPDTSLASDALKVPPQGITKMMAGAATSCSCTAFAQQRPHWCRSGVRGNQ